MTENSFEKEALRKLQSRPKTVKSVHDKRQF